MEQYNEYILNKPWKIYFSKLKIFEKIEWTEWLQCLGQGTFYLGVGILLFAWLLLRILFYPFTRFCVVLKFHQRAKKREAARKRKEEQKKKNFFEELGHI